MVKLLLTLLLFSAPLAAAGEGAETGASWVAENLFAWVPAASAASAVASPALKLPLSGYVSVWSQDCSSETCAIPLALVKNRAVTFELALPQAPGQAQAGTVKEIFSLPGGGLSLVLNFYAVCPYAAAKSSAVCPALYFQAQAELAGAAGAFCAAAFNEKDFFPFPVLMCGGDKARGVRFGITLHRDKL
jgi:hypothetical protein